MIISCRWAPSVLKSLTRIKRNWVYLVDHLHQIQGERGWSDVAKEKASNLRSVLLDANFLILMIIQIGKKIVF